MTAATLGLIALASYLQVSGLAQLAKAQLSSARGPDHRAAMQSASFVLAPESHTPSARALLDRNPFDSRAPRPLDAVAQGPRVAPSDCSGMSATLIASFPDSETSSLAALTPGVGQRSQLVRVGESIAGKTVRVVEWNRVVLAQGDATCQIETFRSRVLVTTSESRHDEVATAPADDISKAVRRVGPTEVRIDRSAIGRVLANPFEFLKATRIVPEQQNGTVVGIRLFGIRPDSLLGSLGFENGDRLENVNGFELGTPEQMMTAYGNLRSLEHLTVRLSRAGQVVNLDIEAR